MEDEAINKIEYMKKLNEIKIQEDSGRDRLRVPTEI